MKKLLLLLFVINSVTTNSQQIIDKTIQHDGLTRSYKLYIPNVYTGSTSVPLLFNLHGYTSNSQEQLYYGDFRSIADTANFIMALPQGTLDNQNQAFWNARYGASVDDLGFIEALIDTIANNYNIDLNRVYSTGMSNGGFMSFTLACELSDKITAVASVTGSMITTQPNFCSTGRPVPIMQIHGTADPTVNYNGSTGIMSINNVINHWVNLNNCNSTPSVENVPNVSTSDNCTASKYTYSNGDMGTEVIHYKITDGGHTWPGAAFNIGVTNQDFDASVEIWKFFNQYQLDDFVGVPLKEATPFKLTSSNLVNQYITYEYNGHNSTLNLVDLSGQLVGVFNISKKGSVDISHLKPGIYILSVMNSQTPFSIKIVKL